MEERKRDRNYDNSRMIIGRYGGKKEGNNRKEGTKGKRRRGEDEESEGS